MAKAINLTGKKFNRLAVVGKSDFVKYIKWSCICDCGNKSVVRTSDLIKGLTKSCGCYHSDMMRKKKTTHGRAGTPEYNIWATMKRRCDDPKNPFYGGRGISYCEEWVKFESFILDMGDRPTKKHSIDRVNNDLGYCKENCRWATRTQQNNNTRKNIKIQIQGETKTIAQWAKCHGVNYATIYRRIELGWDNADLLNKPRKDKRYN